MSLKELLYQVIQIPEQYTYLAKLLGYDYSIQYRTGKSNAVADALSRAPEGQVFISPSLFLTFFSSTIFATLYTIQSFHKLLHQVQNNPSSFPNYKIHQDHILYKNCIWIDHKSPLCTQLLEEFHSTPLRGHMGITKILARLKSNFFREGLRHGVQIFISNYTTCQQTK